MGRGAEVIVAGAGALGLTTALALADAGCRVTVCDPAPLGANASGVAAGMLAPVFEAVLEDLSSAHFGLLLAARDLWPALAARTGLPLDRSGALAVGDAAWLEDLAAAMIRLGARGVALGGDTARGLAPGLSTSVAGALWSREDWRVDARRALAVLRAAAKTAGVVFQPVAATGRGGADFLVAATGASGSAALSPALACITPVKGHILRLATVGQGGASVRAADGYVVPAGGGLAVGATMEPGISDPSVDPLRAPPLQALAERLFPASRGAAQVLEAGVRAATPDGLPMAGPGAEPGVLLAAGARRNGWLLAPLVAKIVTAQVTGADPGPHAAVLTPGRFDP